MAKKMTPLELTEWRETAWPGGMSKARLAREIGADWQTVNNWEKPGGYPPILLKGNLEVWFSKPCCNTCHEYRDIKGRCGLDGADVDKGHICGFHPKMEGE